MEFALAEDTSVRVFVECVKCGSRTEWRLSDPPLDAFACAQCDSTVEIEVAAWMNANLLDDDDD